MFNCSQHYIKSRNINRKIKNMHRNTTEIKQDFTSIFIVEVFIVTHLYKDISQCYVASYYVFFLLLSSAITTLTARAVFDWILQTGMSCPLIFTPPVKTFNMKSHFNLNDHLQYLNRCLIMFYIFE